MEMNRKSRLLAALTAGGIIAAISVYAMVGEQISKSLSGTVKLPTEWTEHPEAEHVLPPQAFDDPWPAAGGGAARPAGREQRASRA
jgi:hypothetical protein